ncbi:hypothetical protein ACH5RR_027992 [Cinchona calisaya]|uniref:Uncharacterized protein n=1 Tax=Cinchona calisaya TaxID=153742 RepID=A0ABD2YNU9_9GENT
MLSEALKCNFIDVDDYHPQANKALTIEKFLDLQTHIINLLAAAGSHTCAVKSVLLHVQAEIDETHERILKVDVTLELQAIVNIIQASLIKLVTVNI